MTARPMEFESLGEFTVRGYRAFAIAAPWTFTDRKQFHGPVVIDGRNYRCVGVEAHCVETIRAGEPIGLLTDELVP